LKLWKVVGWREIGWRLAVVEAPSLTGNHHTVVEQPFLDLAPVLGLDNLQMERRDSAVAMIGEGHRGSEMARLLEGHIYSQVASPGGHYEEEREALA
jgi:hypothetical protein